MQSPSRRSFLIRTASTVTGAAAALAARAMPARAVAPLLADSFARPPRKGWGKPWFNQRYGNAWSIAGKRGVYVLPDPQEGAGAFNPSPVLALDHDTLDVSLRALMSADKGQARFGLLARAGSYGDYYAAYLDGATLKISRFSVAKEQALAEKALSAPVKGGASYWIRFEVSGAESVTLRAKSWKNGTKEPRGWLIDGVRDADGPIDVKKPAPFGFLFLPETTATAGASFRVGRFTATSSTAKAKTRPHFSYIFAGRSERDPDGTYKTRVVAKLDTPAKVVFRVGSDPNLKSFTEIAPAESFGKPVTHKASLTGVAPGTKVFWRAVATTKAGRKVKSSIHTFETPAEGGPVSFAFGSCSHLFPVSRSYGEAIKLRPAFFAHLGDLGYAQDEDGATWAARPDWFQDRWTRMLDRPTVRALHETAAWIMVQDDHDYGVDNATRETLKEFTIGAWGQMSANFDGGLGYFDTRYGDMHCFFVDVHRYSDRAEADDGPGHSILGADQKAWLKQSMRASDANLLVLLTPMPFWGLGSGLLTWKAAFLNEGEELLDFMFGLQSAERRVIVCSGNAHAQYIARHSHPTGGKDIIEFVSSGTDRIKQIDDRNLPDDGVIDRSRAARKIDAFGHVELTGRGAGRKVRLTSMSSNPDDLGRTKVWDTLELDL